MRLRTTVFPLAGVYLASSRVTSPTRCRMVKKPKLQEGRVVIPCRRSLTTGRVLRSWGDQGAPIADRRARKNVWSVRASWPKSQGPRTNGEPKVCGWVVRVRLESTAQPRRCLLIGAERD